MALLSMTGFGKGEGIFSERPFSVEVRTVNGKNLDLSVRTPRELSLSEGKIRQVLQERFSRGSVQCTFYWGGGSGPDRAPSPASIDRSVAKRYLEWGRELEKEFQLPEGWGVPPVSDLFGLPGVLLSEEVGGDEEAVWTGVEPVLRSAIEQTIAHRREEGAHLEREIIGRVDRLEGLLNRVAEHLPGRLSSVQTKLRERVAELLGDQPLDEGRISQEIAVLVDKLDVTEEMVRFRSHNALFLTAVGESGPHGRKLGFLLQEMGREANTLGTKSQCAEMQHLAVEIKEELEILREQVLNIE